MKTPILVLTLALTITTVFGCFQAPADATDNGAAEQAIEAALENAAFPNRPDGPLLDAAGILPARIEKDLDVRLRQVLDNTQTVFIVVTVQSLEGENVAAYTPALARKWEVGAPRGGVVLLVAPNERTVQISTDDTLRERLTDEMCKQIIEQVLLPRFEARDFAGGITAGVEAVASRL